MAQRVSIACGAARSAAQADTVQMPRVQSANSAIASCEVEPGAGRQVHSAQVAEINLIDL